jgi:hypothetical protein
VIEPSGKANCAATSRRNGVVGVNATGVGIRVLVPITGFAVQKFTRHQLEQTFERRPAHPHASYNRMSRYDCMGLVWLLNGNPVVALTEITAAIQHKSGSVTIYRKLNKPALGPLGDSLDDFIA